MKIYVFALLVVATVAIALANEDEDKKTVNFLSGNEDEFLKSQLTSVKEHYRVRRFTCDLLSGLGWNHSPCAIHCILRGKTGGRCNSDGVCVCRARSFGK